MHSGKKAQLVLEDGSIFYGFSFGAEKNIAGEVVFSTGMTGYPESLTDPSYHGQVLCLTYPLIGNYGVPANTRDTYGLLEHFESNKIQVHGLVISDYSSEYSHWNAKKSLGMWLKEHGVPGIYGVDTRALTKHIRKKGAMLGKVVIDDTETEWYDPNKEDIVKKVSIKAPILYDPISKKSIAIKNHKKYAKNKIKKAKQKTIVLVDCGVKYNIIRCFLKRNVRVLRVPYDHDFLSLEYDGLFISNGPGDPKRCTATIGRIKEALKEKKPVFGICLGNQLLALAAGADTYKLKFGHRSQNQPCLQEGTKRCFITTQNHGFAVNAKKLPRDWSSYFTNINDNTNEGIKHKTKPFFSCQFHPEATPGPVDTEFLFDEFIAWLD